MFIYGVQVIVNDCMNETDAPEVVDAALELIAKLVELAYPQFKAIFYLIEQLTDKYLTAPITSTSSHAIRVIEIWTTIATLVTFGH